MLIWTVQSNETILAVDLGMFDNLEAANECRDYWIDVGEYGEAIYVYMERIPSTFTPPGWDD